MMLAGLSVPDHAVKAWPSWFGISVHGVARLLGHTDATLVLRRYGHALPDEFRGRRHAHRLARIPRNCHRIVTGHGRAGANPHG